MDIQIRYQPIEDLHLLLVVQERNTLSPYDGRVHVPSFVIKLLLLIPVIKEQMISVSPDDLLTRMKSLSLPQSLVGFQRFRVRDMIARWRLVFHFRD